MRRICSGSIISKFPHYPLSGGKWTPTLCPKYTPWTINVRALSTAAFDPYRVLGVAKNATAKEIKLAYFREAKKWHPDVNPGDNSAKTKFQQVSAAYELLSDPVKRQRFDATGSAGYAESGGAGSHASQGVDPEDLFRSVSEDVEVVKDALRNYVQDIQQEFSYAAQCAGRGEWSQVWEVAKNNKMLILGVVGPGVLIFRFPAVVMAVGRLLLFGGEFVIGTLAVQGRLKFAASWLWKRIVALSREQNARRK